MRTLSIGPMALVLCLLFACHLDSGAAGRHSASAGSNSGTFSSNSGTSGSNSGTFSSNSGTSGSNSGTFSSSSGTSGSSSGTFSGSSGTSGSSSGTFSSSSGTSGSSSGGSASASGALWRGDFSTGDLRQWEQVQCGAASQDISRCPSCSAGWSSGNCPAAATPSPLLGTGGRFQIVRDFAGSHGAALRLELRDGDAYAGGERNELAYSEGGYGYHPDDGRYFGWSTYFDASFASFDCGGCRAWNVFMQLHQTSDTGSPLVEMDLEPNPDSPGRYLLALDSNVPGNPDNPVRLWATPLQTDVWSNFTLFIHFSATPNPGAGSDPGYVRLWTDIGGLPPGHRLPVNFAISGRCPSVDASDPTRCFIQTLNDPSDAPYLKMGHYRDAALTEDTVLYDWGMVTSTTPQGAYL